MEPDSPPSETLSATSTRCGGLPPEPSTQLLRRQDPPKAEPGGRTSREPASTTEQEESHAVFQQALEILRQEMPAADAGTAPHEIQEPAVGKRSSATGISPTEQGGGGTRPYQSEESQPIPARMMNEFVYCQRLFYYEFVEGVFVESADTLRGGAIHQRVDSGSGALPPAKKKAKAEKKTAEDQPAATIDAPTKESEAQDTEPETIHSR